MLGRRADEHGLAAARGRPATARWRRRLAAGLALLMATALAAGCGGDSGPKQPPPTAASGQARPAAPPSPSLPPGRYDPERLPAGWSLIAHPIGREIAIFSETVVPPGAAASTVPPAGPAALEPTRRLADPNPRGARLTLLVEHYRPDWLRVALPVRPNGTTGWVRTADVRLEATPFALAVDRARHELTLYKDGEPVRTYPVGIGTGSTPTPTGRFYLAELLRPANPAGPWGPYAFGLSGFSDVITNFNGAEGIIGLHGTNQPALVGSDVSMGCIRLRNEDILELADLVPVGTPITIT